VASLEHSLGTLAAVTGHDSPSRTADAIDQRISRCQASSGRSD